MAKKDSAQQSVRQIIADIRKGNPAPVYILHGEEAYYIDLIVSNLEKYVVDDADKDFNLNVFYGNDADIDYVVATAQQFPVFAPHKLVLLKEAQGMTQARTQLDKFASYVSRPNMTNTFVIVYKGEPLSSKSALLKAAKESESIVFRSDVPREWEIDQHVRDYCMEHQIAIEEKARQLLQEYIGMPLSKLFGELNKLVTIKGSGQRITTEDVEKNIGISKDFNNLELINSLARKDYPKSIQIIKYFESNPKTNPTEPTVSIIFNYFSNLVSVHYLPDKSDTSINSELGLKSKIQLNNIKLGLKNYSPAKTVNAIHYLREFDTKSKGIGSAMNKYELLCELIFKLFT